MGDLVPEAAPFYVAQARRNHDALVAAHVELRQLRALLLMLVLCWRAP